MVKNPPADAGDVSSVPGLGRSPGEGKGNLLQYSCLENPMDRGAWRATVHGAAKSRTQLSDWAHSTVKTRTQRASGLVSTCRFGDSAEPGEGLVYSFTTPHPGHFVHLAFPELHPFITH